MFIAELSVVFFSAVKFAELCAKPSFRMHLRTESALVRVLDLLKDAPEVPVRSSLVGASCQLRFFVRV